MSLPPDKERKHGFHRDVYYPGLVQSIWSKGPFRLMRERKYANRLNIRLKSESWVASIVAKHHRVGVKYERITKSER